MVVQESLAPVQETATWAQSSAHNNAGEERDETRKELHCCSADGTGASDAGARDGMSCLVLKNREVLIETHLKLKNQMRQAGLALGAPALPSSATAMVNMAAKV